MSTQKYINTLPKNFKKDKNKVYIAIIGSRNIDDDNIINDFLMTIFSEFEDMVIISGGAKGIDTLAEFFADDNDLDMVIILPDWQKYGKAAGMIRNKTIVNLADIVIAIQKDNSKGTQNSIDLAKKLKKTTYVKRV